jgi:AcrR family transcriptional regulator
VGRKPHDARTAEALLDTAERIVESEGLEALTVRRVAEGAGTSTRAVYSVYGSKDGLVVALGRRAFDYLREQLEALPETADPGADLVEAGVRVFRTLVTDHPSLFRIGVLWGTLPEPELAAGFRDASKAALASLRAKVARLGEAGDLGGRPVPDAAREFHALCEGLAAMELRSLLPPGEEERIWRDALTTIVRGFAIPARTVRTRGAGAPSRAASRARGR